MKAVPSMNISGSAVSSVIHKYLNKEGGLMLPSAISHLTFIHAFSSFHLLMKFTCGTMLVKYCIVFCKV